MKLAVLKPAWLILGIVWLGYCVANLAIYLSHPNGAGDFSAYYRASRALIDGQNLYIGLTDSMPYLYPPLLAQVFAPVIALTSDFRTASIIWFLISILALLGIMLILNRYVTSSRLRIALWFLPLIYMPIFQSLLLGQVTIILAFFTVAAWFASRSGYPTLSGFLLTVAAWIKIYPALLLVYFLWKRDWRVIGSAIISSLGIIVLQIAISGTDTLIGYFRDILPSLAVEGQAGINHSNNSILGFAQKMFSPSAQVILVVDSPLLVTMTRLGLTILILGGFVYLTTSPWRTLAKTSTTAFDLEYALVLTMALLLGSTLDLHGMISMLLPMTILFQNLSGRRPQRLFLFGCVIFAIALINFHYFLILGYLVPPSDKYLPALVLSLPFFGMMILWGLTAYRLRQIRAFDNSIQV